MRRKLGASMILAAVLGTAAPAWAIGVEATCSYVTGDPQVTLPLGVPFVGNNRAFMLTSLNPQELWGSAVVRLYPNSSGGSLPPPIPTTVLFTSTNSHVSSYYNTQGDLVLQFAGLVTPSFPQQASFGTWSWTPQASLVGGSYLLYVTDFVGTIGGSTPTSFVTSSSVYTVVAPAPGAAAVFMVPSLAVWVRRKPRATAV